MTWAVYYIIENYSTPLSSIHLGSNEVSFQPRARLGYVCNDNNSGKNELVYQNNICDERRP
jgi:hypothetical protein